VPVATAIAAGTANTPVSISPIPAGTPNTLGSAPHSPATRAQLPKTRDYHPALVCLSLAACGVVLAQTNPAPKAEFGKLSMYWIDTEGGAATLIVSPSGESLLIDTGFPVGDRDAKRIFAAAKQAGLSHIDHLVISHWHGDHEGGLAAFSKMMPISKFYDHGDSVSPEDQVRLDDYKAVAGSNRVIVRPGDKIPMKDLEVLVVTSDQKLLVNPVNGGGPNSLCANAPRMAPARKPAHRRAAAQLQQVHLSQSD
jgi:beta-lactamase superfamily II metal-dependent hydrolase